MEKLHFTSAELNSLKQEVIDIFREGLESFILKDKKKNILLSRKDTAEQLCISLPTLNEWTKNGTIKAYRIGGRVLYKLNEIHDALEEVKTLKNRKGTSC